jgi:hypothetical protein
MPEEPEIETQELQEHVEEAHHHAAKDGAGWTRYVALSTASFAAFAAVGAMHAGSLVNQAMIDQIRAADEWNEYQADKQKAHSYSMEANRMLDAGVQAAAPKPKRPKASDASTTGAIKPTAAKTRVAKLAAERLTEYEGEADREIEKSAKLAEEAKKREEISARGLETHERFAYSVALLQVAIALGAVSAIAKSKAVWFGSAVLGLVGIGFFVVGFAK